MNDENFFLLSILLLPNFSDNKKVRLRQCNDSYKILCAIFVKMHYYCIFKRHYFKEMTTFMNEHLHDKTLTLYFL